MIASFDAASDLRAERWRAATRVNLSYWTAIYVLLTIRLFIVGGPNQLEMILLRLTNVVVGALLCLGIWAVLERMAGWSFLKTFLIGFILMLSASLAFSSWVNLSYHFIIQDLRPAIDQTMITLTPKGANISLARFVLLDGLEWLPMFLAWGGFAFGLLYNSALQQRERVVGQLQSLAYQAQLRALRYQVDPHFLYNSFNTIASLVLDRENELAEASLVRLASYFRQTLTMEPAEDVRLDAEVDLQKSYLAIEQLRFPDELAVEIDVAPDAGAALVPGLILQPLVENAVKYGLHRESNRTLTLRITAAREGEWLAVEVSDDGGDSTIAMPSTGTGLRNVKERLQTRYGDRHHFEAGPIAGGYTARLRLPYRTT